MYRGPSVEGKRCDPRTLPHWPIAMYIGVPVARFVSEAKLWATRYRTQKGVREKKEYNKLPTPGNGEADCCIGSAGNAEASEVPHVDVIRNN